MSYLFCGKVAVGGNYNSTHDRKRDIQIGKLIITECGCGGRKDDWIIRFDNEYVYHTFQFRDEEEIRHYRILDVKEKISDM